MIVQNPNLAEVVNMLVIYAFVVGGFIFLFAFAIKRIMDKVHDIDIKLQAMTPENRALSHAYFKILFEEHKKEKDYDKRLDKMFEDERSE